MKNTMTLQEALQEYKTDNLVEKINRKINTDSTLICVCDKVILEVPKSSNPVVALMQYININITRDNTVVVTGHISKPDTIEENNKFSTWTILNAKCLTEAEYTTKVI